MAFAPGADVPALLLKGAFGTPGGQLDFSRDVLTPRNQWVAIPLKAHRMGHYVLSVVACGDGPPRLARGAKLSASYFESVSVSKRRDLSNGG